MTAALPITVANISKTYGAVHALDDVSLNVHSGEFLTLLGPSGSGKTTLLMVLAGFTRPDCGSLKFGDSEMIRIAPHLRDVGMVFQNYALFPHMTVAGNVGYPLKLRKLANKEITERIQAALNLVQLDDYGERRINQLSGGQKQRVALARAIVFEPRILLMDEPLSALDKKLRDKMQIELRKLHEKLGMTTVYVTHDQREALTMSDRIAVVNNGRIMQLADPQTLYDHPANRFVADFIGDSTFLPVSRHGDEIRFCDQVLEHESTLADTADPVLMVRPERMQLLTADDQSPTGNVFAAVAADVVYQGDSFLLYANLEDGSEVSMRGIVRGDTVSELPRVGDSVRLRLNRADTILIDGKET